MILHASLAVDEPRRAAETIAAVMAGEAFPFREIGEDAWIAMAGDEHGTLIEFLKSGTELHYRPGGAVAHRRGAARRESGTHLLIETPYDETRVLRIAEENGCRAHRASHGGLELIELWIDSCLLIEVVTRPQAAAYRRMATLANVRAMVGESA